MNEQTKQAIERIKNRILNVGMAQSDQDDMTLILGHITTLTTTLAECEKDKKETIAWAKNAYDFLLKDRLDVHNTSSAIWCLRHLEPLFDAAAISRERSV